jgi:hypothetical protein
MLGEQERFEQEPSLLHPRGLVLLALARTTCVESVLGAYCRWPREATGLALQIGGAAEGSREDVLSQGCHSPVMITVQVRQDFEPDQRTLFASIRARAATSGIPSASAVARYPWSAATRSGFLRFAEDKLWPTLGPECAASLQGSTSTSKCPASSTKSSPTTGWESPPPPSATA